jgi:hypothetical protein
MPPWRGTNLRLMPELSASREALHARPQDVQKFRCLRWCLCRRVPCFALNRHSPPCGRAGVDSAVAFAGRAGLGSVRVAADHVAEAATRRCARALAADGLAGSLERFAELSALLPVGLDRTDACRPPSPRKNTARRGEGGTIVAAQTPKPGNHKMACASFGAIYTRKSSGPLAQFFDILKKCRNARRRPDRARLRRLP